MISKEKLPFEVRGRCKTKKCFSWIRGWHSFGKFATKTDAEKHIRYLRQKTYYKEYEYRLRKN